jgi:hypothetical protein
MELRGHVPDAVRAVGDLLAHLVLQVGADRQERDGGDRERDRRHRAARHEDEPGLQGEADPHAPVLST